MENTATAARLGDRKSRSLPASLVRAVIFTLFFAAAFLAMLAFLLYRSDDPTRLLVPAGLFCLFVSAFLCGFRTARLHRKSGLLCGVSAGLLLVFTLLLAGLIGGGGSIPTPTLLSYLGVLAASVAGGALGARARHASRRGRRH